MLPPSSLGGGFISSDRATFQDQVAYTRERSARNDGDRWPYKEEVDVFTPEYSVVRIEVQSHQSILKHGPVNLDQGIYRASFHMGQGLQRMHA